MSTIRDRLLERDRDRFVGRIDELTSFEAMLDGSDPRRIAHVVGNGGIGKSALLRAMSRRATTLGFDSVWLDGRDVSPFPNEIDTALSAVAASKRALVIFDSYELVNSLDTHLRDDVIPEMPDSTIVVFASRVVPSPAWFEQGWDSLVHVIELGPLDDRAADDLVRGYGVVDDTDVRELVNRSRGSPLALVVGAEAGPSGSVAELADRLLRDEVDPEHLRTLSVAAIARVTTPELLADVLDEDDPYDSYKWLADRSFSEPLATGITLHALVAEAVRAQLRSRDPFGEGALRRRIADHLHRRALAGNSGLSSELQHLIVDPAVKWGYAADVGHRFRIDTLRAGDIDQITDILYSVGARAWWDVTRAFFEQHPELVSIARDGSGAIGGYAVTVTPAHAPALAHADVLLGPWLRYARDELRTTSAVLWREAIDLTGELGEVTSLLGAGGLIASGIANPRYLFLPIAPEIPAAGAFSERLGAVHLAELDLHAFGVDLECHVVDTGPGGLIGNQRDWIYRETGASPPTEVPDVDPSELLKFLREPAGLAAGPTWLGRTPAERLDRLRTLTAGALAVFGSGSDDQLARAIVTSAYLGDNPPHEAVARQLHLSRSAYFRRLNAATGRVGEEVLAHLRDPNG